MEGRKEENGIVEGNGMEEQMERKDVALEWNGSGI
jgi:hypothetical protein